MSYRCWRCGCLNGSPFHPYALCEPCIHVVSPEEIDWVSDMRREPDHSSMTMTPMGKECGA